MTFSINNTFRWKNWDANIYLYGSLNGWKLNDVKYQSIYGVSDLTYGVNALSEIKNRWSPANPTGTLPGVAEASSGVDPASSDFFFEKSWYLRLDNVSIGYNFPSKWFKETNVNGQLMTKDNSTQLSYGALPLKYGKDPDMTDAHSGIDVVVYRYADVLLTLSECIVRNTGSVTTEAINLVNRVRNRAGLPALTDTQTASTDAFMEAILAERGHEFYLEGLRRQDLIRFGKYVEYANQRIADANATGKSYFTVTDAHNRFFIPQTFIDESKSAIKQNAGY